MRNPITTIRQVRSFTRAVNGVNRSALSGAEARRASGSISNFYNEFADIAIKNRYWNWGYFDARTAEAISSLHQSSSDGLSEQLYLLAAEAAVPDGNDFTLIEIGCGLGEGLRFLASLYPRGDLVGVDSAERAISVAQRVRCKEGVRFMYGDAQQVPLADKVADCLITVESMHNYASLPSFLAESARVLRSGGVLSVVDFFTAKRANDLRAAVIAHSGFTVLKDEDISAGVRRAISMRIENRHSDPTRHPGSPKRSWLGNVIRERLRRTMLGEDFLRTKRWTVGTSMKRMAFGSALIVTSYRRIVLRRR